MARHNAKHQKNKNSVKKSQKLNHSKKINKSNKKTVNLKEQEQYCRKIKTFLQMTEKGKMLKQELAQKCHSKRNALAYQSAIEELLKKGIILEQRKSYALTSGRNVFPAETVRLHARFGFIRDENGKEYFVAGKFLSGSMVGDKVLAKLIRSRTGSPEAEIISVLEENPNARLTGKIVYSWFGGLGVSTNIAEMPLEIDETDSCLYQAGDKVLCEITHRGHHHMEHKAKIIMNFGSADSAESCVKAKIAEQDIPVDFMLKVLDEAKKVSATGVTEFDLQDRLDLREEIIFTIDGAHSKDLDDAVSVKKHADGWTLGVHIADVSHYVKPNSILDSEAFRRGTSIYYANQVIPMLPKALSNGICSLNAGHDRLTISAIMELSPEGDLISQKFYKSVICSKVRGVYHECNQILDQTASQELLEKYAPVTESLVLLAELADKLEHLRKLRGAPELESTESELLLDENGCCIGLAPVQRGKTERIIEACMLCANEAVAKTAREKNFPLVYRVHENPSPERIAILKEMLLKLNQPVPNFDIDEIKPVDIQKILDNTREQPCFPVINNLTLRSMAKARYSNKALGHFGLALKDYAHFTSPIRRYPDLVVHRILSDYLAGAEIDWLQKRYAKFTENASERSSNTEVRAVQLERDADACYAAEYMQAHIGEVFKGVITSVTEFGLYVQLENMAEGLLHVRDMPFGECEVAEGWYIKNILTNKIYKLGDVIEVICTRTDVSAGHIDLALA
ncbi:MAG: ribonuclease R [Oscillospiraceae bacterium]|nr:ribonuclease R [Oscillospiraceae bacterium]